MFVRVTLVRVMFFRVLLVHGMFFQVDCLSNFCPVNVCLGKVCPGIVCHFFLSWYCCPGNVLAKLVFVFPRAIFEKL